MSIFQFLVFLCARPATTFLVLTHCLYHCVASFHYVDSGARDVGTTSWSFRAIAWQHLHLWSKRGLLYIAVVFVCIVVVCLFFFFIVSLFDFFILFFKDSNMISISTVEFRHYVVLIILVNLGKPQAIRD